MPRRKYVDRAGRPAPARGAVAVARSARLARDGNPDGTAIALPLKGLLILAHEALSPRATPAPRLLAAIPARQTLQARRPRSSTTWSDSIRNPIRSGVEV